MGNEFKNTEEINYLVTIKIINSIKTLTQKIILHQAAVFMAYSRVKQKEKLMS